MLSLAAVSDVEVCEGDEGVHAVETLARMFHTEIETPSVCGSRRKEALTDFGLVRQRNMEPPYVGCYDKHQIVGKEFLRLT